MSRLIAAMLLCAVAGCGGEAAADEPRATPVAGLLCQPGDAGVCDVRLRCDRVGCWVPATPTPRPRRTRTATAKCGCEVRR